MFYTHYRGRCIGRLIGALEFYGNLRIADYATYGSGIVTYFGKTWATYRWIGDTDIPFFTFQDDVDRDMERKQDCLLPFMDNEITRFNNVEYVVQQVGKEGEPTDQFIEEMMRQHLFNFTDELIRKHHSDIKRAGTVWRHYHDHISREMEKLGRWQHGTYPGIPQELRVAAPPQLPYKDTISFPRLARQQFARDICGND